METTSPAFRHTLPLQLRFNDIDLLGHVNNSVYFSTTWGKPVISRP